MKIAHLFLPLCLILSAQANLVISEFAANPDDSVTDSDGDSSDWIELQNTGTTTLSTVGYHLSDDPEVPSMWPLPALDLAPGQFLFIFASGKDRNIANQELHSNFSLSSNNAYLALNQPGGAIADSFDYPEQFYGFSFGHGGYFATPTPNANNNPADFTDYVRDTKFSVDRGFYDSPFTLEITTSTPGAEIRYTTDGSDPLSGAAILYTGPIYITTTTVIRAIATKANLIPSNIDSQSYFFLNDVINQSNSPDGFPATWGIDNSTSNGNTGLPRPADYEMDPQVIQQFGEAEAIAALRHHPTISVVMDPYDLWNESTDSADGGIYPNPYGGTGNQFLPGWGEPREWERPCSVEFIGFEKVPSKKVNAGIRMAGNYARHPNRYKHHFRLTSRREYGPAKFKGELFSRTDVDTFDDFILRGGNSESWTFPGASGNGPTTRSTVQYIRDQFYKDAQIDMGNLSASQEYFHLYLNGVYWGFYTLIERVDAHFLSQHLGGDEEDFDVIKQANVLSDGSHDDWEAMYDISRGGVSDAAGYAAIQEYLDLDNFIDYIVFNFWAGTVDWRNNWRAGRRSRNVDGFGFQFYNWDGERGLGDQGGNKTFSYNSTSSSRSWSYHPNEMHHDLKLNPEYQIRFADRVQKHFFNGGTLSPERSALLYNARAEEVKPSLIAESARWGDRQRASNPYTTENEWQTMLDYMNVNFFPRRNPIVLNQLRNEGVFPNIDAPNLSRHGGQITDGFPLLISANSGTIYYTTDGSDPRLEGGDINSSAFISTGGSEDTELISSGTIWKYNDDDLDIGTSWRNPSFDDDTWKSGPSPIGYGGVTNTIIATTLVGTPVTTAYFRKQFEVTDPSSVIDAFIEANIDGGAVIFLNGIEVLRDNMDEGGYTHSTLSSSDGNEGVYDRFEIPTTDLVTGTNTLSIEIHNRTISSSDMALDLRFIVSQVTEPDVNITSAGTIRTRALNGTEWSALTEASFYIGDAATSENLVISEILYHPIGAAEGEFIELLNISNSPVSLYGVEFTDGISYAFPSDAILGPGERIVITAAQYSGMLNNGGEKLQLTGRGGALIHEFEYNNGGSWPSNADDVGYSLVLTNPTTAPDPSLPVNWLPSLIRGGTPGTSDTLSPSPGTDLQDFFFGTSRPEMITTQDGPTFVVPRNLNADGVQLIVEVSNDLLSWTEGGDYEGLILLPDGQPAMTWAFSQNDPKNFVRARLVQTP